MKTLTTTCVLALMLAAAPAVAQYSSRGDFTGAITIGPTWAMSGDSPLEQMSFKQDFDTGFSFGGWVTGPFSERFGWRAELGRESMSADADRAAGQIDGTYTLWRFQVGLQYGDYTGTRKGSFYGFLTMGMVNQDFSIQIVDGPEIDFDASTDFGLSFGGGYNYAIGRNWGVGGDLHINAGFFESTRWWWTPSAQAWFSW